MINYTWHHSVKSSETTRVALLSKKTLRQYFLKVTKVALHGYIRDYEEFQHKTKKSKSDVKY